WGAGSGVDRTVGGLLQGPWMPAMLNMSVRIGVGVAWMALLAVPSAFCRVFWVSGIVAPPCMAFGLIRLTRVGLRLRCSREELYAGASGVVVGGVWLVAWLWATIPPTFYDELAYHLAIPQRVLETGAIQTTPWVFFTLMPHAYDLLLAWGMGFAGDLGARAIIVAWWVACSLAAWGLAEGITGRGGSLGAAPPVAGAVATS